MCVCVFTICMHICIYTHTERENRVIKDISFHFSYLFSSSHLSLYISHKIGIILHVLVHNMGFCTLYILQKVSLYYYVSSFIVIIKPQYTKGWELPRWLSGKDPARQCRRHERRGFNPWVSKIPWRRAWQPTPVFLPGESHGQKSLAGYSP